MWTVGLTVEIKLRFGDGLAWTVGLTVVIKLRFRDGLVWTVGRNRRNKARVSNCSGEVGMPPDPEHKTKQTGALERHCPFWLKIPLNKID